MNLSQSNMKTDRKAANKISLHMQSLFSKIVGKANREDLETVQVLAKRSPIKWTRKLVSWWLRVTSWVLSAYKTHKPLIATRNWPHNIDSIEDKRTQLFMGFWVLTYVNISAHSCGLKYSDVDSKTEYRLSIYSVSSLDFNYWASIRSYNKNHNTNFPSSLSSSTG